MRTLKENLKTTPRKSVRKAIVNTDQASQELNSTQDQIQEAIRVKAYELYAQRGHQHGKDVEDWLIAEKLVLQTVN